MAKQSSVRFAAASAVNRVVCGESLSVVLPGLQASLPKKDQALLAELCYGTLRYYFRLNTWLNTLIDKPLKKKEQVVHSLILVGLYQLFYTRIPAHAAIGETVQVTRSMGKAWARGLVNGVLRNAQRNSTSLKESDTLDHEPVDEVCATAHPAWLIGKLKKGWPDHWQTILEANNQPPPMTLRVNTRHISRDRYLKKLLDQCIPASPSSVAPHAITLSKPVPVDQLPGFSDGWLSVQDESAQLAGTLLNLQPGDKVLDACCAPGGKTCHLLELNDDVQMDALDVDENRLSRVQENLDRLKVSAQLIQGDGTQPDQWWNGEQYNAILLDAPCSATGVIRRHPDIKLLRQPEDIDALAELQQRILSSLWPLLKHGGTLLYATCSVMPAENQRQIETFLSTHKDASLQPLDVNWGINTGCGRQLFPGSGDGFFYSLIRKSESQDTDS